MHWGSWALALTGLLQGASSASLQQVTEDFGPNPRNSSFFIYVPDKLAPKPPVLLFPHWCHGSALDAFEGETYPALADQYGFIVIYPNSSNTVDMCWDVSSPETLTHEGGGDSLGLVSMVRWALKKYNGDRDRVFVSGVSSGAMMTTTLLGAYPDVFAAGSAWAGVPFGCFAADGYDVWSDGCAAGNITHSGATWASLVHAAYPGYRGWRPKHQILHGTIDETLNYTVFGQEIKQWTSVFGYSEKPTHTILNTPLTNWTRTVYGDNDWFEAYSAWNITHNIPYQIDVAMAWFDLACTTGDCFHWGQEHY
ncbi:Alpha/Beta hydrolase protein [Xylariaceae sp. FL0255]|nr:Alpha/Beta hydrolase protein [Xylariaceae sp. FL0255]